MYFLIHARMLGKVIPYKIGGQNWWCLSKLKAADIHTSDIMYRVFTLHKHQMGMEIIFVAGRVNSHKILPSHAQMPYCLACTLYQFYGIIPSEYMPEQHIPLPLYAKQIHLLSQRFKISIEIIFKHSRLGIVIMMSTAIITVSVLYTV